jgi:hypothetical protein
LSSVENRGLGGRARDGGGIIIIDGDGHNDLCHARGEDGGAPSPVVPSTELEEVEKAHPEYFSDLPALPKS